MGGKKTPLSKICHTYPTLMKFDSYTLPKEDTKKYINHITQPFGSAEISIFLLEISIFCYIRKYRHRLHFNALFIGL